ncbi:MAG: M24 family metallopeptidase [Candidatus Bathyarchaeia archaeon]
MLFSPITSKEYLERIEKTRRMMANQGVDLMLAYADPWKSGNCRYLTGIRPSRAMMEVPEVGYGKQMFSLPIKGDPILWVTDWEDVWVKRQLALQTLEEEPWMKVEKWSKLRNGLRNLGSGVRKVGYEGKWITPWPIYEMIRESIGGKLDDCDILEIERRVKSKSEIKLMEVASNINDRLCEHLVRDIIRHGTTEKEVECKLEALGHEMGADKVDANFMISKDMAWGHSTDTTFVDGDLLSLHCILEYEGYNSDNDRLFGFGNISSQAKELSVLCMKAFENGLRSAKPGAKGSDVVRAAKSGHEFAAAFPWTSGHGIGLEGEEGTVQDASSEGEGGDFDNWTLEPGMTFCLHSGAAGYGLQWGTEDVILVTNDGARSLTKFPRDRVIT